MLPGETKKGGELNVRFSDNRRGAGRAYGGYLCSRANLKTVLLEKMGIGGQICMSDVIENYRASRA